MPLEQYERNMRAYADVVAKYFGDPDFKARLDANPREVLSAEGIDLPDGVEIRLLFNSPTCLHVVLPMRDN